MTKPEQECVDVHIAPKLDAYLKCFTEGRMPDGMDDLWAAWREGKVQFGFRFTGPRLGDEIKIKIIQAVEAWQKANHIEVTLRGGGIKRIDLVK